MGLSSGTRLGRGSIVHRSITCGRARSPGSVGLCLASPGDGPMGP
jgi:hypothetical protein